MKKYIYLFLKGLAMGAVNKIPGVSGGTVAFITGIYEDLIAVSYTHLTLPTTPYV